MPAGKFSDLEWRGVTIVAMFIYVALHCWHLPLYFGILRPVSEVTAPTPDSANLPDAYGFWVRGNTSFFTPGVMNRTDTNASSPTYLHWTPPPEWRDLCIASAGMPIVACSYFQYEAAPSFMTFFYVSMFAIECVLSCVKLTITIRTLQAIVGCLKRTRKYDGGLRALTTPWGMEKSPECTQMGFLQKCIAINIGYMFNGILICAYITMIFKKGFGLVNSSGTGKLYFGAQWNYVPPIDRQELYDEVPIGWHTLMFAFSFNFNPILSNNFFFLTACWWGFGGQDFIGQISSSFGANQVLSDPMADCLVPLAFIAKVVPLIELLRLKNETYGEMKVGGINASASRIIGGPENPYSLQSWKDFIKASTNYQFSPKAILLCEGVATFHMTMSIMAENNITDPRFLLDGDAGMLKWLQFTHIATAFHMGMTVLGIVCAQRYTFGELFKQLRRKKHLMSDDIFYRRAASLAEKRRGMFGIWMLVLVLYTIMMPAGMAMQVYGVKDTSTWISPLNAIFNQPGAEINMLGTPVHFLVCKAVFAIACCAVCLPKSSFAPSSGPK